MFELLRTLSVDAEGGRATGEALIKADHPFFADHFPDHPVLPGSMAVELAAQVAGPLAEEVTLLRHGASRFAVLGMIRDAKFLRPVQLPARLRLDARVSRSDSSRIVVQVTAQVDRDAVLRTELLFAMVDATPEWAAAVEQRQRRVALWKQAARTPRA